MNQLAEVALHQRAISEVSRDPNLSMDDAKRLVLDRLAFEMTEQLAKDTEARKLAAIELERQRLLDAERRADEEKEAEFAEARRLAEEAAREQERQARIDAFKKQYADAVADFEKSTAGIVKAMRAVLRGYLEAHTKMTAIESTRVAAADTTDLPAPPRYWASIESALAAMWLEDRRKSDTVDPIVEKVADSIHDGHRSSWRW